MKTMMTIGGKLKSLRLDAGLTQSELAEKAAINKMTLHHYERDHTEPMFSILVRLCRALNVSLTAFNDCHIIPDSRQRRLKRD